MGVEVDLTRTFPLRKCKTFVVLSGELVGRESVLLEGALDMIDDVFGMSTRRVSRSQGRILGSLARDDAGDEFLLHLPDLARRLPIAAVVLPVSAHCIAFSPK